jgi:hypothetical protein
MPFSSAMLKRKEPSAMHRRSDEPNSNSAIMEGRKANIRYSKAGRVNLKPIADLPLFNKLPSPRSFGKMNNFGS